MYGRQRPPPPSSPPGLVNTGGPIPNNGVIVSGREGLVLECVSNSSQYGMGTLTAADETTLSPTTHHNSWSLSSPSPGVLTVEASESIPASQQGIYTCNMPDSNGNTVELSVGIYPNGFKGLSNIDVRNMHTSLFEYILPIHFHYLGN